MLSGLLPDALTLLPHPESTVVCIQRRAWVVPGPHTSRALQHGCLGGQGPGLLRYRLEGTVHPRRPHSDTSGKSVVPKTTLKSY